MAARQSLQVHVARIVPQTYGLEYSPDVGEHVGGSVARSSVDASRYNDCINYV